MTKWHKKPPTLFNPLFEQAIQTPKGAILPQGGRGFHNFLSMARQSPMYKWYKSANLRWLVSRCVEQEGTAYWKVRLPIRELSRVAIMTLDDYEAHFHTLRDQEMDYWLWQQGALPSLAYEVRHKAGTPVYGRRWTFIPKPGEGSIPDKPILLKNPDKTD